MTTSVSLDNVEAIANEIVKVYTNSSGVDFNIQDVSFRSDGTLELQIQTFPIETENIEESGTFGKIAPDYMSGNDLLWIDAGTEFVKELGFATFAIDIDSGEVGMSTYHWPDQPPKLSQMSESVVTIDSEVLSEMEPFTASAVANNLFNSRASRQGLSVVAEYLGVDLDYFISYPGEIDIESDEVIAASKDIVRRVNSIADARQIVPIATQFTTIDLSKISK